MGFDIHGVMPKNEKGEYFRNNVWWWRPLWEFISASCRDLLTPHDISMGAYNDGYTITEDKVDKMVKRLKGLIEKGVVDDYAKEYKKRLDAMPDEQCDICKGTGTRDDAYVKGKCNACEGKGKKRPWMVHYPFATENVKAFVEFMENSGGFEIC